MTKTEMKNRILDGIRKAPGHTFEVRRVKAEKIVVFDANPEFNFKEHYMVIDGLLAELEAANAIYCKDMGKALFHLR